MLRHLEVKPPILTYPVGTMFFGAPDPLPEKVYLDSLPRTALLPEQTNDALLETARWHAIVTAPMPHRLILGLEWLGGQCTMTQPELADLLCVSLDSLKRSVAHYRAIHVLTSGAKGIRLIDDQRD